MLLEQSQSQCVCPNTRSHLDILWSCLSTIFLCTWVAVNPNMPGKGEHPITTFLDRLKMMFCGLIAPEAVFLFSVRQWIGARAISKEYKGRGWTMTHAFFLIMGGFVLRRGEEDLGVVSAELLRQLNEAGEIVFSSITREEIEDKSKGDALSKGLVILQTFWFTVQCISRGAQGLAVTELELATLAFCSLNAAIYFMWWYKPLDVKCTMPIFIKPRSDYVHKYKLKRAEKIEDEELTSRDVTQALEDEGSIERASRLEGEPDSDIYVWHRLRSTIRKLAKRIHRGGSNLLFGLRNEWHKDLRKRNILLVLCSWIMAILVTVIIYPILYTTTTIIGLIGLDEHSEDRSDDLATHTSLGSPKVHSYYSPPLPDEKDDLFLVMFAGSGVIFGSLHLIAWNFDFPSRAETFMWRYASLFTTILPPFLLFLVLWLANMPDDRDPMDAGLPKTGGILAKGRSFIYYLASKILFGIATISTILYFPARMILLFEAFYLLRRLPPSAFLDIDCQNFIPHF